MNRLRQVHGQLSGFGKQLQHLGIGTWQGALVALVFAALLPASTLAQQRITGFVTDRDSGEPLPGASVILEGMRLGSSTDLDGRYSINGVAAGTYAVTASFIGFDGVSNVVTVRDQEVQIDFELTPTSVALASMEVFASRALERRSPVAFSHIDQARIQRELGARDVPLVLNSAPSVYATTQGGGAGDARVNVRGFNQRNVSILFNGIPINDMENGWLYWSNVDGLGEVTNSIQMQRGLAMVTLATPSIGGTMNILTDPAKNARQVLVNQKFGNDGFRMTTVMASTGLLGGKFAATVSGLRKTGRGYVDGTWTNMWGFYGALGWNVNSRHRVDLIAFGIPQRHGQNLFRQNIAAYDHKYARKVFERDGLDAAVIDDILNTIPEGGRRWNQNIGAVSTSYTRDQHNGFGPVRRTNAGYIDEIENFFHKPIVGLSHFGQLTDRLLLSTVLYYSGGKGGGSGRHGDLIARTDGPSPVPDYDANIERNSKNGVSLGIIRNRHNVQWTLGGITKVKYGVSSRIQVEAGLDWRSAEIQHFSTVRDLLGGSGYLRFDSDFWPESGKVLRLGDRFNYDDVTTVDWLGGFVQGQYDAGPWTGFAVLGFSGIQYSWVDYFADRGDGRPFQANPDPIYGNQVKGGVTYELTPALSVFASAGRISKVPVFDGVVDAISGSINSDPKNETFLGLETGATFVAPNRKLTAKLNLYNTVWNDRTVTRALLEQTGDDALVNIQGLNARHRGIEGEIVYQPFDFMRSDVAFSIGDWRYTQDVFGTYSPDRSDPSQQTQVSLYLEGVPVGDAPQTQFAMALTAFPRRQLHATLTFRAYGRHYADFDPAGHSAPDATVWKAPPYAVMDLQAGYEVEYGRLEFRFFAHIFNLTNAFYVQDATNNSRFAAYAGNGIDAGTADDAAVFLGLPRTFNVGTRISFR